MLAFKLYVGESDKPPRDAYISDSLREAFNIHMLGSLKGRAQSTLDEYDGALTHWEEYTDNPPICEATDGVLEAFRNDAYDDDFSPATVNKWMRHLQAIFNRLGPKCSRNKKGKNILADVPFFEMLPEVDPDPVHIKDAELNAFYQNCNVAEWPFYSKTGCSAMDVWRCVEVLLVTYGPRRTDLFRLKWSHINFENNTIGWRAQKTAKWHYFPMTPIVRAHLWEIRGDREFVIPTTKSNHYLYDTFAAIQSAAKIKRPNGKPYGFQHLRQTCASRCHDHMPGTAEIILGHKLGGVTQRNYIGQNGVQAAWRCINTIPMPSAFRAILSRHQTIEEDTCNYNTGSD